MNAGDESSGAQTVALVSGPDGARVGVGTASPAEALDVNGTAELDGLRISNGAVDGHVLTTDGAGNASWQAPSAQAKQSCAGILTTSTTGTGTFTINFPVTFDAAPYLSVSALLVSGANAGKPCLVTNLTVTTTDAQMDLQYHDGATWQDVGSPVTAHVSYTAIEQ
jgi:hypothetical protein